MNTDPPETGCAAHRDLQIAPHQSRTLGVVLPMHALGFMETTMKKKQLLCILSMSLLPLGAMAGGHQVCGNQVVPDSVRHCPNGGMPIFIADSIKPIEPSRPADQPRRPPNDPAISNSSDLSYYYGVWRTSVPGAVWTSPSGYQGQDWLHVSAGAAAGDLIIKPNGTYVWASYGGKAGRWVRGDAEYPIILIDTVENRHWKVGADRNHTGGRDIMVWDGKFYTYNGRR